MKTIIKILLLLVFSVGAIATIILLGETLQDPIPIPETKISYEELCNDKLSEYKQNGSDSVDDIFVRYDKISNLVDMMYSENFINEDFYKNAREEATKHFAGLFNNWSNNIFSSERWNSDDIKKMDNYCGVIFEILPNDSDTKSIQQTVKDYYSALSYCNKKFDYESKDKSIEHLNKINGFLNHSKLKNNKYLKVELPNARERLANCHYYYVNAEIDRLGDENYFERGTAQQRREKSDKVNRMLNELRLMENNHYYNIKHNNSYNALSEKWQKLKYCED